MEEIKRIKGDFPNRIGPLYVWWSEVPERGTFLGWGGSDVWKCDEHPDWQGEDYPLSYALTFQTEEKWEQESVEAHLKLHNIEWSK